MRDMAKVTVLTQGNNVTSTIKGNGLDELRKVLEKMDDGYEWKLEVYSTATLTTPKQSTSLSGNPV
jgi:hypothetical protein